MNYEEIYDQAGFFASIWDQLPKEFTESESTKPATTSFSMVIWDCSENSSEVSNNPDEISDNPDINKTSSY